MPSNRLPATACLIGLAPMAIVTLVAVTAVPHALEPPRGAPLLPVAAAALIAVYAVIAWRLRRRPASGDATAAVIGLVAGACWSVEIFIGGPARVSYATEQAIGATFAIVATVVTLSASALVAARSAAPGTPRWRSGVLAGLVSAQVVFVFAVTMTLLTLHTLGMRSDYRHQFPTSGARTIDAFLVQDIIGAVCAHLLINLLLGVAGAGVAIVITRARWWFRPRSTSPS